MTSKESHPVVLKLPTDIAAHRAESLFAYVVNGDGKLVETVPFKAHSAHLQAGANTLKRSRVFVGGGVPSEVPAGAVDVFALVRAGYYQVSLGSAIGNEIQIQHLPTAIGPVSELYFCEVQGTVNNTVTLNGTPQSGPVCKARVHICAVEWYFRWPVWLRPVVPLDVLDSLKSAVVALHDQPVKAKRTLTSAKLRKPLPADLESQILASTPATIHDIVAQYPTILYPYFCWWEIFWPWFYRVVEQDVVYTDCNGQYDAWLVGWGAPVEENIYVWVEASIGGSWVTVYNPPFPCNTWWNYACGTAIDIALEDSSIPPCNCDATVVDGTAWFTAIGQYGIATAIQQDVTSQYAPAGIYTVGCTNLFDSNQLCPFGSELDLYLAFGPTAPA